MDHVAAVAEHLHLDVARALDHAFQIEAAIAEGGERLGARLRKEAIELRDVARDADAAAAASRRRLDHHGETDLLDDRVCHGRIVDAPIAAGHRRHASLRRNFARGDLVAHRANGFRARSNEDQPGLLDGFGEESVLGQESVARMDRIDAGAFRGIEDRGDVQIRFRGLRRADVDGLVCELHRERFRVRLAVHLHRADTKFMRRADDADRNLAAVGYEELLDRHLDDLAQPSDFAQLSRSAIASPGLNRLLVFDVELRDLPCPFRLHLIKRLHHLD